MAMVCAAGLSTRSDLRDAASECLEAVAKGLDGRSPSLVFVFASTAYGDSLDELPGLLEEGTGGGVLLGCTGEMIAGGNREIESGPALSVLAAAMPESVIEPFRVTFERTADGLLTSGIPENLGEPEDVDTVFLLADPFSSIPQSIFDRVAEQTAVGEAPGAGVLGGMASGGRAPGENRLFLDADVHRFGAVGAVVRGPKIVHSVVSQGCRPIGETLVVTEADANVVKGLGGRRALEVLQETVGRLDESDRQLVNRGLHLGVAMSEYGENFGRGDFLIANVMQIDPEAGAVVIGNEVRVGQTVRFQVRRRRHRLRCCSVATGAGHGCLTSLITMRRRFDGNWVIFRSRGSLLRAKSVRLEGRISFTDSPQVWPAWAEGRTSVSGASVLV